ncbi:MAG: sulfotransferase [Acidobacteriota bacterium]
MSAQSLPTFFLAGVPKSGSTSLYRYLDQHPDIYMSPIKEPNFFADEARFANFSAYFQKLGEPARARLRAFLSGPMTTACSAGPVEGWDGYLSLFKNVRHEKAIGEASVCYLWSPTAAKNIAARVPQAKFVIILRNPAERAFSQYKHMLSFALDRVDFRAHVQASMAASATTFSELYPFLNFGFYGEQLERLFQTVERARVGIWFYEDFCRDPARMLREVCQFLNVDDQFVPDVSKRHMEPRIPRGRLLQRIRQNSVWRAARQFVPANAKAALRAAAFEPAGNLHLSPRDRTMLVDYYREDLRKLSRLLDRDFSSWMDTAVAAQPGL